MKVIKLVPFPKKMNLGTYRNFQIFQNRSYYLPPKICSFCFSYLANGPCLHRVFKLKTPFPFSLTPSCKTNCHAVCTMTLIYSIFFFFFYCSHYHSLGLSSHPPFPRLLYFLSVYHSSSVNSKQSNLLKTYAFSRNYQ